MNDIEVITDIDEQFISAIYPGMKVSRLTWEALPDGRWRAHLRLTPESDESDE